VRSASECDTVFKKGQALAGMTACVAFDASRHFPVRDPVANPSRKVQVRVDDGLDKPITAGHQSCADESIDTGHEIPASPGKGPAVSRVLPKMDQQVVEMHLSERADQGIGLERGVSKSSAGEDVVLWKRGPGV